MAFQFKPQAGVLNGSAVANGAAERSHLDLLPSLCARPTYRSALELQPGHASIHPPSSILHPPSFLPPSTSSLSSFSLLSIL